MHRLSCRLHLLILCRAVDGQSCSKRVTRGRRGRHSLATPQSLLPAHVAPATFMLMNGRLNSSPSHAGTHPSGSNERTLSAIPLTSSSGAPTPWGSADPGLHLTATTMPASMLAPRALCPFASSRAGTLEVVVETLTRVALLPLCQLLSRHER